MHSCRTVFHTVSRPCRNTKSNGNFTLQWSGELYWSLLVCGQVYSTVVVCGQVYSTVF